MHQTTNMELSTRYVSHLRQQRHGRIERPCPRIERPVRPARTRTLALQAKKQRVCVIGSGAAGCTTAWSLSRYPEKYQVDVWEASDHIGGHGSTIKLPGGIVMNDCVLGGTYSGFTNTLALLRALGWTPHHADIPVMFTTHEGLANYHKHMEAAGTTDSDPLTILKAAAFGTDIPNSDLYKRHKRDIRRFLAALRWAWESKNVLVLLCTPLRLLCRILMCSDAFWLEMVAPLGIMFFGTGQRMGDCPIVILANAFFDDSIGAPSLLADQDTFMKTNGLPFWGFPRFGCFYNTIAAAATASGNVTFLTSHPAAAVEVYDSRQNLRSQHRNNHNPTHQDSNSSSTTTSSNSSPRVVVTDQEGAQHVYDAIAMACHAPTALRLLSKPSKLHEAALGGVEYYKQSTILPTDEAYIRRYHPLLLQHQKPAWHVQQQPSALAGCGYELVYQFSTSMLAETSQYDGERSTSVTAAAVAQMLRHIPAVELGGARAATREASNLFGANPSISRGAETEHVVGASGTSAMSSTLTKHRAAAATAAAVVSDTCTDSRALTKPHRFPNGSKPLQQQQVAPDLLDWVWEVALPSGDALSKIDPGKILSVKTYEHPAHTVGHFLRTLALLPRIQGRDNIYFAGGWTFVDAHEFAIQSGLAAAHRLGAPYPFETDRRAAEMFDVFMKSVHGVDMTKGTA